MTGPFRTCSYMYTELLGSWAYELMVASVYARIELVSGDFVTTTLVNLWYGPVIYACENSGLVATIVESRVRLGMLLSVK